MNGFKVIVLQAALAVVPFWGANSQGVLIPVKGVLPVKPHDFEPMGATCNGCHEVRSDSTNSVMPVIDGGQDRPLAEP